MSRSTTNTSKLPRDLIEQITRNPRSIRFLENLQTQTFDALPDAVAVILATVQQAQITADTAQTMAIQALNKSMPDVLCLVGVPLLADDVLGLVSIDYQTDDLLIPICVEVLP